MVVFYGLWECDLTVQVIRLSLTAIRHTYSRIWHEKRLRTVKAELTRPRTMVIQFKDCAQTVLSLCKRRLYNNCCKRRVPSVARSEEKCSSDKAHPESRFEGGSPAAVCPKFNLVMLVTQTRECDSRAHLRQNVWNPRDSFVMIRS